MDIKKNFLKNSAQPARDQAGETCNCTKEGQMPLEGNCVSKAIVYQAKVISDTKTETYVGLAGTEFKGRFKNHLLSLDNETGKNDTELSKHIWQLKSKQQYLTIKCISLPRQNST